VSGFQGAGQLGAGQQGGECIVGVHIKILVWFAQPGERMRGECCNELRSPCLLLAVHALFCLLDMYWHQKWILLHRRAELGQCSTLQRHVLLLLVQRAEAVLCCVVCSVGLLRSMLSGRLMVWTGASRAWTSCSRWGTESTAGVSAVLWVGQLHD
jgi:hypothetical protein